MKTSRKTQDVAGFIDWVGVFFITGAYLLLSLGIIDASLWFQIPTLVGSLIVAVVSWLRKDRQPAILNFIFAAIAIIAIFRLLIMG